MNEQCTLFGPEISVRPTFWYPGSKGSAVKKVNRLIPPKTKVVISPFIGGGSIELSLTARNIRVKASDLYEPLANCWQHIIKDGSKLAKWCKNKLLSVTREELMEEIESYDSVTKFEQAGYQWLKYTLSMQGVVRRKNLMFYHVTDDGNAYYKNSDETLGNKLTRFDKLQWFYNPLLSVEHSDYEGTLNKYPNSFVYLDPPYIKMSGSTYGSSGEYDNKFDHERLAKALHNRETPFLLSYGDHEETRKLYPESKFDWTFQDWGQTNFTGTTVKNEVMIRPKQYLDYWN